MKNPWNPTAKARCARTPVHWHENKDLANIEVRSRSLFLKQVTGKNNEQLPAASCSLVQSLHNLKYFVKTKNESHASRNEWNWQKRKEVFKPCLLEFLS